MKSIQDVLSYIDTWYSECTKRPESYFPNVECMESELSTMEGLYEFILDDSRGAPTTSGGYFRFLGDSGYGSLGFLHGKVDGEQVALTNPTLPTMAELGQFWQAFLSSDRRLKNQ